MKVALVYDRVNKWGGAERVLLALHKLFPNAPLFTSVYNKKTAQWADVFDIKTSFLQKLPFVRTRHDFVPYLMPSAFEQFSFDDYDLVVSVTSEAAKGIITKPTTKHICYCLTPTRYLWSGYDTYFSDKTLKMLTKPVVSSLRKWDKVAAHRPDVMIAISKAVQERIKDYYGRDSVIIYPPLDQGLVIRDQGLGKRKKGKPYFLVVSRFVQYKRIDLAIEALSDLGLSLKVIGSGSLEKRLQAKAGKNIEFLHNLTDEELVAYYKGCEALVFPGVEDFGLVMAEAHRFGKPVIAFAGGGALDIVVDGQTGIFFKEQTTASLREAINRFHGSLFDPKIIMKQAEKFSFDNFKKQFTDVVNKVF
ncbi:MAG TPA: glycosyltransferase [Patescibacteria group bacterium]|nr:glycosyltransferase [Patescibacteria group bacterium]